MKKREDKDASMQRENAHRQIEKDIRKAAENTEIPKILRPENLPELLGQGKRRKRRIPTVFPAAAACGALLLLCAAGIRFSSVHLQNPETAVTITGQETEAKTQESQEEMQEIEESIQEIPADETEGAAGDLDVQSAQEPLFTQAESYEEIREMVQEAVSQKQSTGLCGTDLAQEDALEEGALESYGSMERSAEAVWDTNLRTEGVEEGDTAKTDGTYLYNIARDGSIRITQAENLEETACIQLEEPAAVPEELYVDGNRLYIIAQTSQSLVTEKDAGSSIAVSRQDTTQLYLYDIRDREHPRLVKKAEQNGSLETCRYTDGYFYLVSRQYLEGELMAAEENGFLPLNDNGSFRFQDILLPQRGTPQSYLTVSAVDGASGETKSQKAVLVPEGFNLYYVSEQNLYLCVQEYRDEKVGTSILRLNYQEGEIQAQGASYVTGAVRDSFCIDEYQGYLRVLCQQQEGGAALYILNQNLQITGSLTGIAGGEEVKSARFLGETAYFVTYRQVDPLFCVSLADPSHPQIQGELKVSGFSGYLHLFGEDRLLGIGWEIEEETGITIGLKLSMFDLSQPENLQELHRLVVEDIQQCAALDNYRAALVSPEQGLIGTGILSYDEYSGAQQGEYLLYSYSSEQGFQKQLVQSMDRWAQDGEAGQILEDTRGIYINDRFYLVNPCGISCYDRDGNYEEIKEIRW